MSGASVVAAPSGTLSRAENVGQAMRIDGWTLRVIEALRAVDARPILLKGPAITEWLYGGDRALRPYNDADILVHPERFDAARVAIRELGFVCNLSSSSSLTSGLPRHAECWFRAVDHAAVDLHRSLHRTEHLSQRKVWDVVSRDPDIVELFGTSVDVPSIPVRALHAVLHLRPKDHAGTRAWIDLERAIEQTELATWERATDLAREIGIASEMGALLRFQPAGAALADELTLEAKSPLHVLVEHDPTAPVAALFLVRLSPLGPIRAIQMICRWLIPPAEYVRKRWPLARRGSLSLAAVYTWRLVLIPRRLIDVVAFGLRRRPASSPKNPDIGLPSTNG